MNAMRALAAAGLLLLAAPSSADLIVPVAQARSVTAEANHPAGTPDYQSAEAPDFAAFGAHVIASSGDGASVVSASANQSSTIGADRIDGRCTVQSLIDRPEHRGQGQATCIIDVTFDVEAAINYRLNVSFSYGPNDRSQDELILTGPDGVIVSSSGFLDRRGTLAPGRYRLQSTGIQNASFGTPSQYVLSSLLTFEVTTTQTYTLTGKFTSHRGQLIDLPLLGDVPCPSLTLMSGPGAAVPPMTTTPPARTMTRANAFGCVGAAVPELATTGAGVGGAFTLPTNALAQPLPESVHWLELPNATPLLQVQTSLAFAGPAAKAPFHESAWKDQPGRIDANFAWCIGDPTCIKAAQGSKHAIVKYTAGPRRFGGTMRMLALAGPNRSQVVLGNPAGGVTFIPIAATGTRPTGGGYALAQTDPSLPGSGWAQHMTSANGRITMGTGYLGPRPGTTVMNYGFPFTTGRVLVRETGTQLGIPQAVTLSAVGGDTVTSMGARNLSLVAGALAASKLGAPSVGIAQVALPEPDAAPQRVAAVIALLAIAAWRARRRRR
jgi:hypothetical protein